MAYTETGILTIPQVEPNLNIIVRLGADILFSEIFNGVPQFYPGSSFDVEEIFEATFFVYRPELIDIDFRWNPSKVYIGTWRLSDTLPSEGMSPEDEGFITYDTLKLKRYSRYTIQANADVEISEYGFGSIDNCNFLLSQDSVNYQPTPNAIPLPPTQIGNGLLINDSTFKYRNAIEKVGLIDRVFIPKIRYVGLYVNVGAGITSAKYTARVINGISVDLPSFPIQTCTTLPPDSCELLYNNFLAQGQISSADGIRYPTFGLAESARLLLPPVPATSTLPGSFVCPNSPFTIYDYFFIGYGGGSGG